jgi:hypothetical protein
MKSDQRDDREDGSEWLSSPDKMSSGRRSVSHNSYTNDEENNEGNSGSNRNSAVKEKEDSTKEWSAWPSDQIGFERSNSNDFFEQENNSPVDRPNFGSLDLFSDEISGQPIRSQKQSVSNQKETNNVHSESPSVEKEEDSNSNSVTTRSKPTSKRRSQRRSQRTISSQSPMHPASVRNLSSLRSMISKETPNSIADPSNKNKSRISGTQISRTTASSSPSKPTISPSQKSSESEQHSQKMSSNRIHGSQRSHSHRTNPVASGGPKATIVGEVRLSNITCS